MNSSEFKEVQLSEIRHKLRTPVNHIIGYSELLIEEIGGELFEEWSKLKEICHDWTIVIVKDVIEPELVILFGRENDEDCAWTLFEEGAENFTVVKCSHPSGLGTGYKKKKKISRIAKQFKQGLEMLKKNEKF